MKRKNGRRETKTGKMKDPQTHGSHNHWLRLSMGWLPVLVAFLLYLPALRGGMVWDDPLFLNHPLYRDLTNWVQALIAPFLLSPNYYRPLAVATFLLAGNAPWMQHLLNVLLHTLNTALVTLLAAQLTGESCDDDSIRFAPLIAGLLYAIHPALIEGIAFISGRFDLLATTFLLLALLGDVTLHGRRWLRPLAVGFSVLLAALSKEMTAAFLLVFPLWHLSTLAPHTLSSRRSGRNPAEIISVYLSAGAGLGVYLAIRFAALGYLYLPNSGRAIAVGDPFPHLLLVGQSLTEYVLLTLLPFTTLSPIHFSPLPVPLNSFTPWVALVVTIALLWALMGWIRHDRATGALAAAGVVALLPVLNVLPLELGGGAFIAERFLLFPMALLALAVGRLWGQFGGTTFLRPVLILWAIAAVGTVQLTVPHWRSDQTLWEWGIRRAPRSAVPYTNLALVAINQGDATRGLALAEQALARDPNEGNALNHRGLALFHLGRYPEAEKAFAEATRAEPENALYWSNLAGALREQDKLEAAEQVLLDKALQLDPMLGMTHFNLGLIYLKAERPDLAIQAFSRALELLPPEQTAETQTFLTQAQDPVRWLRFGDQLLARGEFQNALQAFAQAEQFGAVSLDVAVGRSAALIALQKLEQAQTLLQVALLSAPEDARLYNNLGLIAQTRNQPDQASALFQQAIEFAPDWDVPRQNLAALLQP